MKVLSGTIIVISLLLLIILGIGYSSPLEYSGFETRTYEDSEENIWEELTNIYSYPERKRDVVNIEILEKSGKTITKWRENTKFGGYRIYEVREKSRNNKFVLEIIDSRNTLKGIWTYTLNQEEKGIKVTISEESQQSNIFWRGLNEISGRDSFIDHEFKWIQVALFQRILYE